MLYGLPVCEVPGCASPVFALSWVEGLRVHPLCMEHTQNYIDATVFDGINVRSAPLNVERHRN